MTSAYQQIELDDESKKFTTINTQGLFQYNRLSFGISSSPSQFQRIMENVLKGLKSVIVYLDDILVTSTKERDHLENLDQVLSRLEAVGLTLKQSKCKFVLPSVVMISAEGLHPSPQKIEAVRSARQPTTVSELKSFLGLINYYIKFVPIICLLFLSLYTGCYKRILMEMDS